MSCMKQRIVFKNLVYDRVDVKKKLIDLQAMLKGFRCLRTDALIQNFPKRRQAGRMFVFCVNFSEADNFKK